MKKKIPEGGMRRRRVFRPAVARNSCTVAPHPVQKSHEPQKPQSQDPNTIPINPPIQTSRMGTSLLVASPTAAAERVAVTVALATVRTDIECDVECDDFNVVEDRDAALAADLVMSAVEVTAAAGRLLDGDGAGPMDCTGTGTGTGSGRGSFGEGKLYGEGMARVEDGNVKVMEGVGKKSSEVGLGYGVVYV